VDGKLYLFGGYTNDDLDRTSRVDVYDPVANKWAANVARMPAAVAHLQTAVDGHDVYLAGGVIADRNGGTSDATFTLTSAVWRYNTDTNEFTAMPPLPKVAAMGGMVLVGRELHYVAGAKENGLSQRGDHWVLNLDAAAGGWQTAAALPTARKRFASAAIDGKIYVIGGHTGDYSGRTYLSTVHVFDPAAGTWTKVASLPGGHSHFHNAADVYEGRIIVAGGKTDDEAASNDVLVYDPGTNKWSTLTNLPSGRSSGPLRVLNGTLVYTTGSSGGGSFESTTWRGTFVTT
jgi:N-acetylneuraminic acid mutarotase